MEIADGNIKEENRRQLLNLHKTHRWRRDRVAGRPVVASPVALLPSSLLRV